MSTSEPPLPAQARLMETMVNELAATFPEGWDRIHFTAHLVDDRTNAECMAERDGRPVFPGSAPATPAFTRALTGLRAAMAAPTRGTWFGMTLTVTAAGSNRTTFDYDHEPQFLPPPAPEAYARDLERFPRVPDLQPEWLRERLSWASLTPRQKRLADLGRASLQEQPMIGGTRPLFPVTALPGNDGVLVTFSRTGTTAHVAEDGRVRHVHTGPERPMAR